MTTNHLDPDAIEEAFDKQDEKQMRKRMRSAAPERHPSLHPKPLPEYRRRAQANSIAKHQLEGHWF